MQSLINYCKSEIVLVISLVLAVISMVVVRPDSAYIGYIDFRTLSILWCLMLVMSGLRQRGVFAAIGRGLLEKCSSVKSVVLILVMLCFFFSMFITNDVALITFVPFTIEVLVMAHLEEYMILVIVLQTIAANLGSMMTPIGNPQNLYLYSLSGMSMGQFLLLMLPYTVASLILLLIAVFFVTRSTSGQIHVNGDEKKFSEKRKKMIRMYVILFLVSLTTVFRLVPYPVTFIIMLAVVLLRDRKNIIRADYNLLMTFVCLFVFIGNMKRIPQISAWLSVMVQGHETLTSVIASQVISNVPAAILLSGFADKTRLLVIGTNLGGLGTIIASMASLISFKLYSRVAHSEKGKYMMVFTLFNVLFLIVLYGLTFPLT